MVGTLAERRRKARRSWSRPNINGQVASTGAGGQEGAAIGFGERDSGRKVARDDRHTGESTELEERARLLAQRLNELTRRTGERCLGGALGRFRLRAQGRSMRFR